MTSDESGERLTILSSETDPEFLWRVRTLDTLSGAVVWDTPLPSDNAELRPAIQHASMLIAKRRVVVVDGVGHVYCMDLESGRALWSAALERFVFPGVMGGQGTVSPKGQQSMLLELDRGPLVVFESRVTAFDWDGEKLWDAQNEYVGAVGTPKSVVQRDEVST